MYETSGKQILIDMWGVNESILNDEDWLLRALSSSARIGNVFRVLIEVSLRTK